MTASGSDRRLRIVHVVCTDAFAGVERHVATLAAGLAGHGCDVTVVGGDGGTLRPLLAADDVAWRAGTSVPAALTALLRLRRADIVHAHMTKAELAAVLAGPIIGAKVVATRHFARSRGSSLPVRVGGRWVASRLAAQVAVSRYVAGNAGDATLVIPPGTSRLPVGDAARRPVVLVAQRLEPEKRTDLAVEAWQRSGLAGDGWELWIAGDGHERPRLEALASELGVAASCRFLGHRRDVADLQRRAGMLLAPCPVEAFGLSVVEAMAAGLPVVAAARGGHLETIGRHPEAALYPPDDPVAAARLLCHLAADPDRRARYGDELRALHDRELSPEQQVTATLDLYLSVAEPTPAKVMP